MGAWASEGQITEVTLSVSASDLLNNSCEPEEMVEFQRSLLQSDI